MKLRLLDGLPYLSASLTYRGRQLTLENVLLDTGSAGVIFSTDKLLAIGLEYEPDDMVHRIRGVGERSLSLPSALIAWQLANFKSATLKSKSEPWITASRWTALSGWTSLSRSAQSLIWRS